MDMVSNFSEKKQKKKGSVELKQIQVMLMLWCVS